MEKPRKPPPPPIAPKPNIKLRSYLARQTSPNIVEDKNGRTTTEDISINSSVEKNSVTSSPCSSFASSATADANDLSDLHELRGLTPPPSPHNDSPNELLASLSASITIRADISAQTGKCADTGVTDVSETFENKEPFRPPRIKKDMKKRQQSVVDQNTDVVRRDKMNSTSDRSSKPVRGTVMLIMNDLLSKSAESEQARVAQRPIPRPRSKSGSVILNKQTNIVTPKHEHLPVPKPRISSLTVSSADSEDSNISSDVMEPDIVESLVQNQQESVMHHVEEEATHYGQIWTDSPDHNVASKPIDIKSSPVDISKRLDRTSSSPLCNRSPKIKPRRPSAPPPPPPTPNKSADKRKASSGSLNSAGEKLDVTNNNVGGEATSKRDDVTGNKKGAKKLVPTRPPPPVPKNKRSNSHRVNTTAPVCHSSITRWNSVSAARLSTSHEDDDDHIYYVPDDVDVPSDLKSHEKAPAPSLNVSNINEDLSNADKRSIGSSNVDADGSSDDVYLEPVNFKGDWPEDEAPTLPEILSPPRNQNSVSQETCEKSATIQSLGSHIYEDMESSSDDDDGYSCETRDPSDDMYSDFLDETLENEDDVKAGSSSESEAEAEETAEAKLAKQKDKVFKVAQEIVTSEEDFIDKLKLLNIDFRTHVSTASEEMGEKIIPASCMNKILNYLPQLANINEDLLKDLKQRIENWHDDPRIADIFVRKGPFLQMYTTYIKDFQNMTTELDNAIKEYPVFAETLKNFERSERCRNLQLRHYMLKPIQRIPQYRLLLTEYSKYIADDSPDKDDTQTALDIVSKVADHANEAMKENDSLQSLLELQSLLVGDFKVIAPSRVLVRRGDVFKQSRKELQPRTLFLFNDFLVITSPQPGGYYRVKHALPLLHMQVNKPIREDFQKEFTIITKKRSFASVAFNPRERDGWVSLLETTIAERERKKGTYNIGLMENTGNKSNVLGEVAPVWIPDDRVSMCMICSAPFTMIHRRHHCRACGKVVCGACSSFKAPLKYEDYKSKRVCEGCYDKLYAESGIQSETNATSSALSPRPAVPRSGFIRGRLTVKPSPKPKVPTVLQEVHANDVGEFSGYLNVQGKKKKQWEKFWFVLKDKVLYKYNACEDTTAIESKPLLGYKVAQIGAAYEGFDKAILFRLHHPALDIIEPVLFKTETAVAAEKWIAKMQESTTA